MPRRFILSLSLQAPLGARQSVFPLRVLRILSCFALRMTSHFVIAKQKHRPSRQARCINGCGNPPFHLSSLRAPQGARQSVFPLRVLRILSCFALRMTSHFVIAKVRVSGGDLCEAEAPTEPAGGMYKRLRQSAFPSLVIASAARCAAIRFPP